MEDGVNYGDYPKQELTKEEKEWNEKTRKRQKARRKEQEKIKAIDVTEVKEQGGTILNSIKSLETAMRFMNETSEIEKDEFFELVREHISKNFPIPERIEKKIEKKLEEDNVFVDLHWAMWELLNVAVPFLPQNRRYIAYGVLDAYKKKNWEGKDRGWSSKRFHQAKSLWQEAVRTP